VAASHTQDNSTAPQELINKESPTQPFTTSNAKASTCKIFPGDAATVTHISRSSHPSDVSLSTVVFHLLLANMILGTGNYYTPPSSYANKPSGYIQQSHGGVLP
jgi:hypothetical protein